ncbi:site-specific DNA-methyltransferase [Methanomassiliicoccales archaeon LGM-DZ1]|nr:site-specific DNA-methyltransferase [Methanomassiliicoccales archaeon LGM-DZ1]
MTIRYIPYQPEPVTGQAVLSNFNRVLKYKGSNDLESRIVRGMPLYEAELIETVGNPDSGNMVFRGDCISTCAYLRDKGIKVDLVYIDPPFASGADYAKKVFLRKNPKIAEAIEKAESELDMEDFKQFEEKMYGDIWDKEKYLSWMYENLLAIRSVMSENASIYVHLDWHIGHYVKIMLDEIFGEDCFKNEIIWKRSTAHSDNSTFGNLHDSIYYYVKDPESYVFNPQYAPYSQEYIDTYYRHENDDGRRFLDRDLSAKGLKGSGYTYTWKGKEGYWRCPYETMLKYEQEDRLYYTSNGTPRYKQYLDEMPGVPLQDIWADIYAVNSQAEERVSYTTQKPESLLERIINASSNPNMMVADFFGGSGASSVTASKLNRKFIHSDVGINSIQITRDRLKNVSADFDIYEIRDGISLYRNPVQTMDKLKALIPGLKNEDSLDKFWEGVINDPRYGVVPVYVPNLMDSTTRILDEVLMRRILYEAIPELTDLPSVKRVIVYYIDVSDMDKINEMISKDKELNVEIEFRDLKDILDDVSLEDEMDYSIKEDHSKIDGGFVIDINKFYSDAVIRRINSFNLKSAQNDKKGKFKPITISDNGLELIEYISLDCTKDDGVWNSDTEIKIEYTSKLTVDGKKTDNYWNGKICSYQKPLRIKVRNICGDETIFKIE